MEKQCLNCGTALTGPYCSQCGQAAEEGRLTIRGFGQRLIKDLFDLDKGWLSTSVGLTRNFPKVAQNYISGKRQGLIPPFKYAFFINALYLLLERYFQKELSDELLAMKDSQIAEGLPYKVGFYFGRLVTEYGSWFIMLLNPCLALCCRLFLGSLKWNLAEHMAFQAYVLGQACLFCIIYLVLFGGFASVLGVPVFYLFLAGFTAWGYRKPSREIENGLLGFSGILLGCTIFIVLTYLGVAGFVLLFKMD